MFKQSTGNFLICATIVVVIIVFWPIFYEAYAQSISSADLISEAKQYDGKIVNYKGEVIGDIMIRGQYAWLNTNDGQNAIGIWAAKNLIKNIGYRGGYGSKGDVIEIIGFFHRSCPEHGGDLDIHAQSIRKAASGRQIFESLDPDKIKNSFILLGIALLLYISNLIILKKY